MAGTVLCRAESEFDNIPVPEKDYDSMTWGTILAVNKNDEADYGFLVGRQAHWRKFKDDCRVGKNDVLIEIKDILGSSYEE